MCFFMTTLGDGDGDGAGDGDGDDSVRPRWTRGCHPRSQSRIRQSLVNTRALKHNQQ